MAVHSLSKPLPCINLCPSRLCAGPGPRARGGRLPLPGASSPLSPGRGLREALLGLGSHPSLFLPLGTPDRLVHPLIFPTPRGRWPAPRPFLGPSSRGQVRRRRTRGRKDSCLRGVRGAKRAALGDGVAGSPRRAQGRRARVLRTRPPARPPHLPGP